MQLVSPDIHRIDLPRPLFKQDICEAARGGPQIQRYLLRNLRLEGLYGSQQLQGSAADVSRRLIRNEGSASLLQHLAGLANETAIWKQGISCLNEVLCRRPGGCHPQLHQQLVGPQLHYQHSKGMPKQLSSTSESSFLE